MIYSFLNDVNLFFCCFFSFRIEFDISERSWEGVRRVAGFDNFVFILFRGDFIF